MLESNSGALNTAQEDAARIAMLEGEVAQLRRRDAERNAELDARERRIRLLEEALRILQSNRFGSSREKLHVAPGQAELFNEAETVAELNEVLGTEVSLKATPQRVDKATAGTKAGRKAIASHLPRMPVVHDVPEAERLCACGVTLVEIGSDVTEQLDYVPPKIQVLQHVRKKYACPGCDQCVKTAPLPPQILPRSNAAPGLLAHLVTSKYVDAMPLYRQETIFARYGVSLPRATQAAWIIALAEKIQPLINLMDERLRSSGYIRIDETPVQVLKAIDRPRRNTGCGCGSLVHPGSESSSSITIRAAALMRRVGSWMARTESSRATVITPTITSPGSLTSSIVAASPISGASSSMPSKPCRGMCANNRRRRMRPCGVSMNCTRLSVRSML